MFAILDFFYGVPQLIAKVQCQSVAVNFHWIVGFLTLAASVQILHSYKGLREFFCSLLVTSFDTESI